MQNDNLINDYHHLKNDIKKICSRLPRAENPTLIAVSKTHPIEAIQSIIALGQVDFGENRVQEAKAKFELLSVEQKNKIKLHLIGGLQTNKVKDAVKLFDVIHSIDRIKLAQALATEIQLQNKKMECFIQVNLGEEKQKNGVNFNDAEKLTRQCQDLGLNIAGYMCIPPQSENPEYYFNQLTQLAKKMKLENLSMGMSSDYAQAIECGATHIRVGSQIFGKRPVKT